MYGAPRLNRIFALPGSRDPGCNDLWEILEEALAALAGAELGQGRYFNVYDDMALLAMATAYIQRYGLSPLLLFPPYQDYF